MLGATASTEQVPTYYTEEITEAVKEGLKVSRHYMYGRHWASANVVR